MILLFALQAATMPLSQPREVAVARICLDAIRSPEGQEFLGRDWFKDYKFTPADRARIEAEQADAEQVMKARWRATGAGDTDSIDAVCELMTDAYRDGVLEATADALERDADGAERAE